MGPSSGRRPDYSNSTFAKLISGQYRARTCDACYIYGLVWAIPAAQHLDLALQLLEHLLRGAGLGMLNTPLTAAVINAVPQEKVAMASSISPGV